MYEIGYSILTKVVSGYLQNLGENHRKVILKYLKNTKDWWFGYGESDLKHIEYDFNFKLDIIIVSMCRNTSLSYIMEQSTRKVSSRAI